MANTTHDHSPLRNFRFATSKVDWKDFITTEPIDLYAEHI
jgi:hypothetical protein